MLLTPEIYEILANTKPGAGGEIQLTDAMAEYARTRGGMTAVEFTGKHYDMGNKLKVVEAQVELALQHPEIGEEFRALVIIIIGIVAYNYIRPRYDVFDVNELPDILVRVYFVRVRSCHAVFLLGLSR